MNSTIKMVSKLFYLLYKCQIRCNSWCFNLLSEFTMWNRFHAIGLRSHAPFFDHIEMKMNNFYITLSSVLLRVAAVQCPEIHPNIYLSQNSNKRVRDRKRNAKRKIWWSGPGIIRCTVDVDLALCLAVPCRLLDNVSTHNTDGKCIIQRE